MVTDQEAPPTVSVSCTRCPAMISGTVKDRALARLNLSTSLNPETQLRAHDPDYVATVAARYAARDADWEIDHLNGRGDWLCPVCSAAVAAERRDPCPDWCTHCYGHDFFSEGTLHRRYWRDDDGNELAEVRQLVGDAPGDKGWVSATLNQVNPDAEQTAGDLRALAALAAEVADFLDAHGLVVEKDEVG